jgi:hypothetical protein
MSSRTNALFSDILIGVASVITNRTNVSLALTILRVEELSWKGRCISRTMQPESMTSFYKLSIHKTESVIEMTWGYEIARCVIYASLAHVTDCITLCVGRA